MDVAQLPHVGRRAFCLGIVGLLTIVSGCGGETSSQASLDDAKSKENAEREAREKAFGPGGNGSKVLGHAGKPKAKTRG